jgi:hypothetical protein
MVNDELNDIFKGSIYTGDGIIDIFTANLRSKSG